MSKTVYAVSHGCYSNYSVAAIFTTKEKAQAFIDSLPQYTDFNDIEEYSLDPHDKEIRAGLRLRRVVMHKSGNVNEVELCDSPYCINFGNEPLKWADRLYGETVEPWASFYVWSRDDKHAVKVANERRIAFLSQTAAPAGEV